MVIGGYEIDHELGQGAYGMTYKVTKDEEAYALKVTLRRGPDVDEYGKYFDNEVEVLRGLKGPNVAQFCGAGREMIAGGWVRFFIIMRYVEGMSLKQMFESEGKEFAEIQLRSRA
jgi:serine/threonine protein kinase